MSAGKAALANFVTTTRGGQLLRVQMVPVLTGAGDAAAAAMGGYVLEQIGGKHHPQPGTGGPP